MSSTIEELYFYFCQMEIMMFETNFTVFRMDGGARDIILCITFSGEEPCGANTNSKTHLWNNQLPQKAVITNIQNFIQKTSFTHLQNENPAQNNDQLPPENKNLLINDTFFNAISFFSLMLGFFQVIWSLFLMFSFFQFVIRSTLFGENITQPFLTFYSI